MKETYVGSKIIFGGYDWRVLDMRNGQALLLSDKVIEKRPYHHTFTEITWAECDLHDYLNGVNTYRGKGFYDSFSPRDKARIAKKTITTNNNPWWSSGTGGRDTDDWIFLLSLEEVCSLSYFGDSSSNLRNRGSQNDIYDANNSKRIAYDTQGTASWWWLRSPGSSSFDAAAVFDVGSVSLYGRNVNVASGGVRPALWLNL